MSTILSLFNLLHMECIYVNRKKLISCRYMFKINDFVNILNNFKKFKIKSQRNTELKQLKFKNK